MAINKVIDRNNNVLIDLSNDTVKSNKVLAGEKFHGADGKEYIGTLPKEDIDTLKYKFIDYDGTLLYSFTDEEIDNMTTLPTGPVHSDEPIIFEEWNWSLEDLKNWDRERIDRPIVGANYTTDDGSSYFYIESPISNGYLGINTSGSGSLEVDWGDGTVTTNVIEHTYENPGNYIVKIKTTGTLYWFLGSGSGSINSLKQWIKKIHLGNLNISSPYSYLCRYCSSLECVSISTKTTNLSESGFSYCYNLKSLTIPKNSEVIYTGTDLRHLESISIPNNAKSVSVIGGSSKLKEIVLPDSITTFNSYNMFAGSVVLKIFVAPKSLESITSECFTECRSLQYVDFSKSSLTSTGSNVFYNCRSLETILFPNTITSIKSNTFYACTNLKILKIPDSVTSIGSSAFDQCNLLSLDLSEQTKVISLSGSIGTFSISRCQKILVPMALLDQYKSASYWSNYADVMVGV